MERIATCTACRYKEQGVKTRIAIPHTCTVDGDDDSSFDMVGLFYEKDYPKRQHQCGDPEIDPHTPEGKVITRSCMHCDVVRKQATRRGFTETYYVHCGEKYKNSPICLRIDL